MAEFGGLSGLQRDPTQARPLRLVHDPLWKGERASRRLGGSRGRGGGEHSNTMHLFTYYFSQASLRGGGCFIQGPSVFLPNCKVCCHPRSPLPKRPRGHGQLQPSAGSDINLLSVCSMGRSPSSHHSSCRFLKSIRFMTAHLFGA